MSDGSRRQGEGAHQEVSGEMALLRQLLLGDTQGRIDNLESELTNRERFTETVTEVVSEALARRTEKDGSVPEVLRPSIEGAIKDSVQKNPRQLADAMFPVIGPAIRRAVRETLGGMLQSFNQALDQSLSVRALKWRVQAWRSGQPYSQVVLLNTLVYQVEQVFLIHRETGLLLGHVQAESAIVKDPDLVSGMLTAVQDFISDSFSVDNTESGSQLSLDDFSILVKRGPAAYLAVAVRGTPPGDLGVLLDETLEKIHLVHGRELSAFDGDLSPFSGLGTYLEECLASQTRSADRSDIPWKGIAGVTIVFGCLLAWWGRELWLERQWSRLIGELRAEPGIVILASHEQSGMRIVDGLRDADARTIGEILPAESLSGFSVQWRWHGFLALDPPVVEARARRILEAPDDVALAWDGGVLRISGNAPLDWVDGLHDESKRLPGVDRIDTSALEGAGLLSRFRKVIEVLRTEPGIVVERVRVSGDAFQVQGLRDPLAREPEQAADIGGLPVLWSWRPYASLEREVLLRRARKRLGAPDGVRLELRDEVLHLAGSAPQRWIDALPDEAPAIVGVASVDIAELQASDHQSIRFEELTTALESKTLYFRSARAELDSPPNAVEEIIRLVRELGEVSSQLGSPTRVRIIGHTDQTGRGENNEKLSKLRALMIKDLLVRASIDDTMLSAEGAGATDPAREERAPEDRRFNRRVDFRVDVSAP